MIINGGFGTVTRRTLLGSAVLGLAGWIVRLLPRRAGAQAVSADSYVVRRVRPGDEDQLLELMQSCVDDGDSFHGLCNALEWTRSWAVSAVETRPRSLVVTLNDLLVAYFDLSSDEPRRTGNEIIDHHRTAFWCGAAGVRMDLLGEAESSRLFQELLYEAFSDAKDLGYEYVRAAAPWDRHPHLPMAFADYPGLTVQPFRDEEGATKYLLEWELAFAVESLAT